MHSGARIEIQALAFLNRTESMVAHSSINNPFHGNYLIAVLQGDGHNVDIALTPEPKPLQTPLTIQPSPKISPCNLIALSCAAFLLPIGSSAVLSMRLGATELRSARISSRERCNVAVK